MTTNDELTQKFENKFGVYMSVAKEGHVKMGEEVLLI